MKIIEALDQSRTVAVFDEQKNLRTQWVALDASIDVEDLESVEEYINDQQPEWVDASDLEDERGIVLYKTLDRLYRVSVSIQDPVDPGYGTAWSKYMTKDELLAYINAYGGDLSHDGVTDVTIDGQKFSGSQAWGWFTREDTQALVEHINKNL